MLKVYILAAATANALLFAAGWYTAGLLNAAPLDAMGNQGFVRTVMAFKGDHITSFWLLPPPWVQALLMLNLLLLSALAAILPVLRASKVAPVQAMKE